MKVLWTLVAAVGLAGCASAPPLPAHARDFITVPASSESVVVRPPGLRVRDGRLELTGFVVKVYEAKTTERTHLDVRFFDQNGAALREERVEFYPRRLINARRAPNRQGNYSVPLDALPAGAVRIEVRAHDEPEHRP
ncbi:MAG: hypothetical protein Q8N18_26340 [Opitutaceae bacterium]|nr:hypothetical protein [Opitutaceae bacterium]